jgi:DNA-directed RNA polymerase specialized sigma24 family protein
MVATSQRIAPHLPFLRRFARALTGSQQHGDHAVAALLEALIADPAAFPNAGDSPRAELYRAFLKTWASAPDRPRAENDDSEAVKAAARSLMAVDTRPRLAFLLTAVEGFTTAETAHILGTDIPDVVKLLEQAGKQIADQMATDVLIIEDEPLVAMDLESIVTSLGHRVTGMARTHTEAVAAVEQHRPGLVLADIQLADGSSGLHAVNEILQSKDLPVIFITAFPERLLTGSRPEPIFLITKPFKVDAVKAIISQVLFFDTKTQAAPRRAAFS